MKNRATYLNGRVWASLHDISCPYPEACTCRPILLWR
jgi:hypothetical protein